MQTDSSNISKTRHVKPKEVNHLNSGEKYQQETKTPVLVCGLLATDIVFNVNAIPTEAVKYRAENVALTCGGGGCYASVAINRLGGCSTILSKIGNDKFGELILDALDSEGIDHTNVIIDQHTHTPISSIVMDQMGERQIINYRDQTPTVFVRELLTCSSQRAVLVDARWIEGSVFSLEYAKSQSIPGVVDAEAPVSEDAMALATHIAFSRQGLSQFASTDSISDGLQHAAKRFSAWICVTDGENGTHVWSNGHLQSIPAPIINSVDTLGAGDVWHGAFTLQLAQGVDELSAVKFANVVAAMKCTRAGGGWSAPELSEVNKFYGTG